MDLNSLISALNAQAAKGNTLSKSISYFDESAAGFPTKGSVIINPEDMIDTVYQGKTGLAYVVKDGSAVDTDKPCARISYSAVTGRHFVRKNEAVAINAMECRCRGLKQLIEDGAAEVRELVLDNDTRNVVVFKVPIKVEFSTEPSVFVPAKKDAWNGSTMLCNQEKKNYVVFTLSRA